MNKLNYNDIMVPVQGSKLIPFGRSLYKKTFLKVFSKNNRLSKNKYLFINAVRQSCFNINSIVYSIGQLTNNGADKTRIIYIDKYKHITSLKSIKDKDNIIFSNFFDHPNVHFLSDINVSTPNHLFELVNNDLNKIVFVKDAEFIDPNILKDIIKICKTSKHVYLIMVSTINDDFDFENIISKDRDIKYIKLSYNDFGYGSDYLEKMYFSLNKDFDVYRREVLLVRKLKCRGFKEDL